MLSHPLQVRSFIYFWGRNYYFPEPKRQKEIGKSASDGLDVVSNCKSSHQPSSAAIHELLSPEFLPPDGKMFQMVAL